MSFCPLLSNTDKKVQCSSNCAWYCASKVNDTTCEISYLTEKLQELSDTFKTTAVNSNYSFK